MDEWKGTVSALREGEPAAGAHCACHPQLNRFAILLIALPAPGAKGSGGQPLFLEGSDRVTAFPRRGPRNGEAESPAVIRLALLTPPRLAAAPWSDGALKIRKGRQAKSL
jgi:hypothetical protein